MQVDRPGQAAAWVGGLGPAEPEALPAVSREIITDCLAVIDRLAPVIERLDGELHQHAKADPRVKVLTTLPGIGEFTALVMLGRGSDRTVRHRHISKQGSAWLRWAMNQAAQTAKRSPQFAASCTAIASKRGKKIATHATPDNPTS